jgi:hypothetical protein
MSIKKASTRRLEIDPFYNRSVMYLIRNIREFLNFLLELEIILGSWAMVNNKSSRFYELDSFQ